MTAAYPAPLQDHAERARMGNRASACIDMTGRSWRELARELAPEHDSLNVSPAEAAAEHLAQALRAAAQAKPDLDAHLEREPWLPLVASANYAAEALHGTRMDDVPLPKVLIDCEPPALRQCLQKLTALPQDQQEANALTATLVIGPDNPLPPTLRGCPRVAMRLEHEDTPWTPAEPEVTLECDEWTARVPLPGWSVLTTAMDDAGELSFVAARTDTWFDLIDQVRCFARWHHTM